MPTPRTEDRSPAPKGNGSEALEDLVVECLEALERGGDSAMEELLARQGERASALRERIDTLRAAGLVSGVDAAAPIAFPERLGDFRLLRHLGGGGMGVVYLALQESLGREVALKLIRPELLYFPGARERFRREVEAIARLHHPGIVPIHMVGEERGIPYFAMECVRGATLGEIIAELAGRDVKGLTGADLDAAIAARSGEAGTGELAPLLRGPWTLVCLRIVREVAEALEHAHRRGILHRDIKPSNVMVTREGRVLLLDFGLATSRGSDRLTRTGSLLGSLPYLSPEQVRGDQDAVGRASDVYSLGVMLYELATLELPFHAAKETALFEQILTASPRPPRALNPALSWDVETVCLTAMERDPARRYASASDFAFDLSNVLEMRPINARRASVAVRARRWMRRHPAGALAVVLGAAVVLGGPALYGVQQHRANLRVEAKNEEIRDANVALSGALADAKAQRETALSEGARAEESFQSALKAVDVMLTRVAERSLRDAPRMEPVRRALLEDALAFYKELALHPRAGERLDFDVGRAHMRLGDLYFLLERFDDARIALEQSTEILARLSAREPERPEVREVLGQTLCQLGTVLRNDSRADEARATYHRAIEACASIHSHDARHTVAAAWFGLGNTEVSAGHLAEAETAYEHAIDGARSLVRDEPQSQKARAALSAALMGLGTLRSQSSESKAVETLTEAREQAEAVLAAEPGSVSAKEDVLDVMVNLVNAYINTGQFALGEQVARAALERQLELVRDFPDIPRYVDGASAVRVNLAICIASDGTRRPEAMALLRDAIEAQERIVAAFPDVADFRHLLGGMTSSLGAFVMDEGDLEGSEALMRRAIELQQGALARRPGHLTYLRFLAAHEFGLGDALLRQGRYAESAEAVERGMSHIEPDWFRWRVSAGKYAQFVSLAEQDDALSAEERAEAVERYRARGTLLMQRAIDAGYRDVQDLRAGSQLDPLRGTPEFDALDARLSSRTQ